MRVHWGGLASPLGTPPKACSGESMRQTGVSPNTRLTFPTCNLGIRSIFRKEDDALLLIKSLTQGLALSKCLPTIHQKLVRAVLGRM